MLISDLLADAATDSLGDFGIWANLTCLAVVLMLVTWEVLRLRPERERLEREQRDRLTDVFLKAIHEQQDAFRETVISLRSEWSVQRQESSRLNERNSDAIANLAAAIQSLRLDMRDSHAADR